MLSKNQVKYIQSLGHKKCRDEEGLFLAEGPKIAEEILVDYPGIIRQVLAVPDDSIRTLLKKIEDSKPGLVTEISKTELEKISQQKNPNKLLVVAEKIKWPGSPVLKNNISLVLDTIQDPGNMGTIIRLADWFGIKNIFCSMDCADQYNPKVVQATMGSITRVRVMHTPLSNLFSENKDIPVYVAVLDGRDISAMKKIKEGIIVIGNESRGVSPEILEIASGRITIPRLGKAESLNAAVAAGIILSHLCTGA
jgi:RNA methyltransferase, TrmH family